MDIKKLLQTFDVLTEGTMKSAEKHSKGPEFTGYWKGSDKATPGKKMVGGESIIPSLAKHAKDSKPARDLMTDWQEFKEEQEMFVLYIDGKPASKYADHKQAHNDLEYIRSKFPKKHAELKQEVCDLKTLPEGKLPEVYSEATLAQKLAAKGQIDPLLKARDAAIVQRQQAQKVNPTGELPQEPISEPAPEYQPRLADLLAKKAEIEKQLAFYTNQKKATRARHKAEKQAQQHQPTPDEERRREEWAKQYGQSLRRNLNLRSEELEEDVEDFKGKWVRAVSDGWQGEVIAVHNGILIVSDGHESRHYEPSEVMLAQHEQELDEYAPPIELEEDSELQFKNTNPQDVVKVDVPLLIRLLEYAREDAKTDMDLHNVAERLIAMSANGAVLSMREYDSIVGESQEIDEAGSTYGPGETPTTQNTQDPANSQKPADQKKQGVIQTQKTIQALKPTLQAAGAQGLDTNKLTQTLAKVDNDPTKALVGQDLTTVSKLAPGVADALKDPNATNLLKQAIQKGTATAKLQQQQAQNQQNQ